MFKLLSDCMGVEAIVKQSMRPPMDVKYIICIFLPLKGIKLLQIC